MVEGATVTGGAAATVRVEDGLGSSLSGSPPAAPNASWTATIAPDPTITALTIRQGMTLLTLRCEGSRSPTPCVARNEPKGPSPA